MTETVPVAFDDGSALTRQVWTLLESQRGPLGLPDLRIQPVLEFRDAADRNPTTVAERAAILEQAVLMFEHFYPHLPFKQEIFDFARPVEFIDQHIRTQLDSLSETRFHSFVLAAFSLVRDAHTLYRPPSPYRGALAFLPFRMRQYSDDAGRHWVVAKVMNAQAHGGFGHPFFGPGAEILGWGEEDIKAHVLRAAGRLPGGNDAAIFTLSAVHSTVRPLTYLQFPFPDEMPAATIRYRPEGSSEIRAILLPWGVATGFGPSGGFPGTVFSISAATAAMMACDRMLHGWSQPAGVSPPPALDENEVSAMPEIFDFQHTGGSRKQEPIDLADLADPESPNARFGYLRIKSFDAPTAELVAEFQRILTLLDRVAPDGLVLDIRGNPGGDIPAAEQMLQMLTPRRISPARFHLANTAAVIHALRKLREAAGPDAGPGLSDARAALRDWLGDADNEPFPQGRERLTSGRPVTDPASANDVGQVYQGRVVLLVDALTYSAADIFTGGFQDHDIGLIAGSDATTGGGGANVWSHKELLGNLGPLTELPLKKLPRDTGMTLAIRRSSRVERFEGQPVEDLGVSVDIPYTPASAEDVVAGCPGLLRVACRFLTALGKTGAGRFRGLRPGLFRVDVANVAIQADGSVTMDVQTRNIASLKFILDGALAATAPVESDGAHSFSIPRAGSGDLALLRVQGFAAPQSETEIVTELVASRLISLAAPPLVAQDDSALQPVIPPADTP